METLLALLSGLLVVAEAAKPLISKGWFSLGKKPQRLSLSAPFPRELRWCVRLGQSPTTEDGFAQLICRVNEKLKWQIGY